MFRRIGPLSMIGLIVGGAAHADEAIRRRLARGEVLVYDQQAAGCRDREVVLKAVIEAPPERVWPLIDRCGEYHRVLPRVARSRELSRHGARVICTMTVSMPFPYSDITSVTDSLHRVGRDIWRRSWRKRSGDYRELHGSWALRRFENDPGRTLMVYRNCAVPEAWVPGWIRRWAQKRKLPEMVDNLRRALRRGRRDAPGSSHRSLAGGHPLARAAQGDDTRDAKDRPALPHR